MTSLSRHYQYPQLHDALHKEKENTLAKLAKISQVCFLSVLSFDILYIIFGYLEYDDFLRCSTVCRHWFDFMTNWSDFWYKKSIDIPNLNKSTLCPLLRGETHEFVLDGSSLESTTVHDLLLFLSYDGRAVGQDNFHKLASYECPNLKEFWRFTSKDIPWWYNKKESMASALVHFFSVCPSLERIKLEETYKWLSRYVTRPCHLLVINALVLYTIAKACPRLRHFFVSDYLDYFRLYGEKYKHATELLETLAVPEIKPHTALTLVRKLEALKHLQIIYGRKTSVHKGDYDVD
ncbi:hypothetical protein BDA99DRAFT_560756 [Phascolomyces articulosus]|uniref:F-box domain-containing protein n=1 Tax=Phascolomyces articulosus TaxID=60185 RepID=A0AAD5K914_9FUNG|nr:hypothetical protein BDA99DRAFT_560756 [Phascolomyces articulosus]